MYGAVIFLYPSILPAERKLWRCTTVLTCATACVKGRACAVFFLHSFILFRALLSAAVFLMPVLLGRFGVLLTRNCSPLMWKEGNQAEGLCVFQVWLSQRLLLKEKHLARLDWIALEQLCPLVIRCHRLLFMEMSSGSICVARAAVFDEGSSVAWCAGR